MLVFKTQSKSHKYKLIDAPFYNDEDEDKFKRNLMRWWESEGGKLV